MTATTATEPTLHDAADDDVPTAQVDAGTVVGTDRWGRPLIMRDPGEDPVPYTKVSTFAMTLDDGAGLTRWKQRLTALGVAHDPELAAKIATTATATATTTTATLRTLNHLAAKAAAAGRDREPAAADAGLRGALASGDRYLAASPGTKPGQLGPLSGQHTGIWSAHQALVSGPHAGIWSAYRALADALAWTVRAVDPFVVDHDLEVAGTVDRVLEIDGVAYVAAIETGRSITRPHAHAIALALAARNLPDHAPHRTKGLLIHAPAGNRTATAYWINLQAGYLGAIQAHVVRKWRALDDLTSGPIAVRQA